MYREDGEETEKKVHRYELGFLFKEKHFKITFYRLKYDLWLISPKLAPTYICTRGSPVLEITLADRVYICRIYTLNTKIFKTNLIFTVGL